MKEQLEKYIEQLQHRIPNEDERISIINKCEYMQCVCDYDYPVNKHDAQSFYHEGFWDCMNMVRTELSHMLITGDFTLPTYNMTKTQSME